MSVLGDHFACRVISSDFAFAPQEVIFVPVPFPFVSDPEYHPSKIYPVREISERLAPSLILYEVGFVFSAPRVFA